MVFIRGRRSGVSATWVTKRAAPPQAPSFIGCALRPRRWCSSCPCSPMDAQCKRS